MSYVVIHQRGDPLMSAVGLAQAYGERAMPNATHQQHGITRNLVAMHDELVTFQDYSSRLQCKLMLAETQYQSIASTASRTVAEREAIKQQVDLVEGRLKQMHHILNRWASVEEPVIASDGFTYERRVISSYFDECHATNTAPLSQQTQEPLQPGLLYPNESVKRLIDNLLTQLDQTPHGRRSVGSAVQQPGGFQPVTAAAPSMRAATHPCVRVYGHCRFGDRCAFASYPAMTCLSFIKGKCRFGASCHELHPTGAVP